MLHNLGRSAEAEPLHRRALAIRERALGPEHPDVVQSCEALAVLLLNDLGRPTEAEPLFRRILASRERAGTAGDLSATNALNGLARTLNATGRPIEAEPLARHALAIRERAFGPDHPGVALSLHALASSLRVLGRPDEAQPLLVRALAIRERALGPDHPLTRGVREDLARVSARSDPTSVNTGADEAATTSRTRSRRSPAPNP